MKSFLFILIATFALNAGASTERYGDKIVSESWSCVGKKSTFKAVFYQKTVNATLNTGEGEIPVSLVDGALHESLVSEMKGQIEGRDSWDYHITLLRSSDSEFSEDGELVSRAPAQVVLVTDSTIDCVGRAMGAELLNCTVVIVRR